MGWDPFLGDIRINPSSSGAVGLLEVGAADCEDLIVLRSDQLIESATNKLLCALKEEAACSTVL